MPVLQYTNVFDEILTFTKTTAAYACSVIKVATKCPGFEHKKLQAVLTDPAVRQTSNVKRIIPVFSDFM